MSVFLNPRFNQDLLNLGLKSFVIYAYKREGEKKRDVMGHGH